MCLQSKTLSIAHNIWILLYTQPLAMFTHKICLKLLLQDGNDTRRPKSNKDSLLKALAERNCCPWAFSRAGCVQEQAFVWPAQTVFCVRSMRSCCPMRACTSRLLTSTSWSAAAFVPGSAPRAASYVDRSSSDRRSPCLCISAPCLRISEKSTRCMSH